MKHFLFTAACTITVAFFASCSGDKKQETTEEIIPKGKVAYDISSLKLRMNIPDSTKGMPKVTDMPEGTDLKVGNEFDVIINYADGESADLAQMKKVIDAADELPKTYTTTDSATIVWQTDVGDMHHFYHLAKIGGKTYFIRDNNSDPANVFSKANVDTMLSCAKSLRMIPAAPKAE